MQEPTRVFWGVSVLGSRRPDGLRKKSWNEMSDGCRNTSFISLLFTGPQCPSLPQTCFFSFTNNRSRTINCCLIDEFLLPLPVCPHYDLGHVDTGIRNFVKLTNILRDLRFFARSGFRRSAPRRSCGT